MLITGSKFLGGAPFCGAVIARSDELRSFSDLRDRSSPSFGPGSPARMNGFKYDKYSKSSEVPSLPIPKGLSSFFSGFDVDPRLTALSEAFPPLYNFGLLLRWRTAINEMQRSVLPCRPYHLVANSLSSRLQKYPSSLRDRLGNEWTQGCEELMRKSTLLKVLPRFSASNLEPLSHSVVSFSLSHPNGSPFTRDDLKEVHELLTIDLSPKLSSLSESVQFLPRNPLSFFSLTSPFEGKARCYAKSSHRPARSDRRQGWWRASTCPERTIGLSNGRREVNTDGFERRSANNRKA